MGSLNTLVFLLVTMTIFSLAYSIPYPFYQHEQCAVKKLKFSDLAGDWHMIYHKDNLNKKIDAKMIMQGNSSLFSLHENDKDTLKEMHSQTLVQNANLEGKLEELVNQGTWTMTVPTFVLSVQPDQYMTLYHSKFNGTDDWAIYSRTKELSQENYDKAIQGLVCMNLVDSKDGKPLLHKLQ